MDNAVELADIIAQLRHDLSRAMAEGEGTDLRFQAEQIELELTVGVERSREPGVKVRFWVFDAGATARQATTDTQRLTLTLKPVRPDAPDRSVLISGDELLGED
ncbi:trypco2 family protein [Streptomyces sp. NBC_01353]|uniref:trypco2 family protein n=1 Tax=unclassified Streptomyces TaxID=2593676 RepID=UPI002E37F4AF|nr:trypco2 family protein [Streptomyces sp. NBC_01353]